MPAAGPAATPRPPGRTHDPLYAARRTLHTGLDLLTEKQQDRLETLFAADEHVEVHTTWSVYQRMVSAYRETDRTKGKDLMTKLISSVSQGVPSALREIAVLGHTL